jgi:hypothetical protein
MMTKLHRGPFAGLFMCLVGLGAMPAAAQETPRLQFEVTVEGALVARPELRVQSGREGSVVLDQARIVFTPTVGNDRITIAFEITSGAARVRPSLVITRNARGRLEWTSDATGQPVRVAVAWVQ